MIKRGDIVVMPEWTGGDLWCVLSWGAKTFDVIAHSGYVERHRHGKHVIRLATAPDFHGSTGLQADVVRALRDEADKARSERRPGAAKARGYSIKRGQVWPSH